MGYSVNRYVYNGGPQQFNLNFALGYVSRSHVFCYIEGELDGSGNQVYKSFDWIDDNTIEVTDTLTVGQEVTVQRVVPKQQLYVDFTNEGTATRRNLNTGFRQSLMAVHELLDGFLGDVLLAPTPAVIQDALAFIADNSNAILEVGSLDQQLLDDFETLRDTVISRAQEAQDAADAAEQSELAASDSENNAYDSEVAAAISASNALVSENNAAQAAASVQFPVSYAPQSLSAGEQAQARENIGIEDPPALQGNSFTSRTWNTTYQNTLDRPIYVTAESFASTSGSRQLQMQIDYGSGLEVVMTSTNVGEEDVKLTVSGVVPPGAFWLVQPNLIASHTLLYVVEFN